MATREGILRSILERDLQDVKSDKLALLGEMLGIEQVHTAKFSYDAFGDKCPKCGEICYEKRKSCKYPDPITTDLRILAWQVRDKMVEMGLWREWQNAIWTLAELKYTKETPEIWIEAGLTVFKQSKK